MALSPRSLFVSTLTLLVASLAANVYLLTDSRASAPHGHPPKAEANEPVDAICHADLVACRRAFAALPRPPEVAPAPTQLLPPSMPAPQAPRLEGSREALCRVARDKLREQWLEKRGIISLALAHDLPDTVKQKGDAERDAERAADALGLKGAGRRGFEDDFVELRRQRMVDMASASQTNPIDWSRILTDTQSLFEGEDALVQRELGGEAAAKYKDTATDGRLTILTILATYADVDWDQTMP
jgi:hypothetical protein